MLSFQYRLVTYPELVKIDHVLSFNSFISSKSISFFSSETSTRIIYIGDEETSEKTICRSAILCTRRTFSMRFSLSSPCLLHRFRSLSTCHFPSNRRTSQFLTHHVRYSSPTTITLVRTKSILPPISGGPFGSFPLYPRQILYPRHLQIL